MITLALTKRKDYIKKHKKDSTANINLSNYSLTSQTTYQRTNETGNKRNISIMDGMASFFSSVLDSLQDQIAVINEESKIVYVNRAWIEFGASKDFPINNSDQVGAHYYLYANSEQQEDYDYVLQGFQDVFHSKLEAFYHEYPTKNSRDEEHWFMMRASLLNWRSSKYIVISHQDITPRKLIEEEIKKVSLQDPLTGLANRRHFNQFWHQEWRRSMRYGTSIGLLMLDIDHFKDFNDTEGHLAGDQCLKKVGDLLKDFAKRPNDMVARFGGEEFIFVLGDAELSEALNIAESIRKAVSNLNIRYGKTGHVTISAGVATTIPERHQPEWWLINKADKALYLAKRCGRDRVETTNRTSQPNQLLGTLDASQTVES